MSGPSKIEWTEHTWNPVIGCTKVSAGCKNCYAEEMALRLRAMGVTEYANGFAVRLLPERLQQPLRRRRSTMYFVNSMSDLFHPKVPDAFIHQVFDVMDAAHWHTFQVLTKRAERMERFASQRAIPSHVWVGASVENRRHGVPRIESLRSIKGTFRFLSIEPLLEDLGTLNLDQIDWVIVGGESGRGARPMKPEWVRKIRDACLDAEIPFFFKQWGAFDEFGNRRSKRANGRSLDGVAHSELPSLSR